ncbi:MAG: recombination regulator RecX [Oscillospiraceae bacterium]|jgi:regulatory protein|nr:recombination regulator RecX [Oscillospiraceae bacterium]
MPQEPYEALWNRALWYLGRRAYGTRELREKLLRRPPEKPIPAQEDVERALARLAELGLLNDSARARQLAEACARKGYGARRLQMELRRLGLENEAPPPPQDETGAIARLLETKYAARLRDEKGCRAVFQALLRRGFPAADIRQAMRDAAECREDMLEESE